MMKCGECLMNKVKMVDLVDRVCPECKADYRDVTEFVVAAVVPDPARMSAPKCERMPMAEASVEASAEAA